MADSEHPDQDHRELRRRSGESDAGSGHHRLHLRRGRHAAVWEELRVVCMQDLQGLYAAPLAHEGLLPLVPHRVPGLVRGMDRDHVGLYGGGRTASLHSGLHAGHGHWKPGGEYENCVLLRL